MAAGHSTRKPKYKDRVGELFTYLRVIRYHAPDKDGNAVWWCRCKCGNELSVRVKNLKTGNTRSCGCLKAEQFLERVTNHGHTRDGKIPPEYNSWSSMIQRCTNSHRKDFKHYGGRGIKVCSRWRESFEAFFADVGARPDIGYSLGRIDNDGGYEPGNVRWMTRHEQHRNMRSNTPITINGRTQVIGDWAKEVGISANLVCIRMGKLKWPIEEALGFKPHVHGSIKLTKEEKKMRRQARSAVGIAVAAGDMPRVYTQNCHICGAIANQYHHDKGYESIHHLDVIPLCFRCHGMVDSVTAE